MARIHDVAQMIKLVFTIFGILFVIDNKMRDFNRVNAINSVIVMSPRILRTDKLLEIATQRPMVTRI